MTQIKPDLAGLPLPILGFAAIMVITALMSSCASTPVKPRVTYEELPGTTSFTGRSTEQLILLADQALEAEEYHEAEVILMAALRQSPANSDLFRRLLHAAEMKRNWYDSLYWLEKLMIRQPHWPPWYLKLSRILFNIGDVQASSLALKRYQELTATDYPQSI